MIKIEYPSYPYKIRNENGKDFIFDVVRKQWVALTPEEWVRQNFLQYLLMRKHYPSALIAVEKEIKLGELTRRCDIVVYNTLGLPELIVECKAMEVEVTAKTIDQVLRYNMSLPVRYLVVTNGSFCFGYERTGTELLALREIPGYAAP
ncbi:MAG: type I restriction enzyme HsdR N-terminal domain-containing protein [Chitinophagaceae bacterium]|nr:type I restriction enzyme HsdR N-terminal domain-containing protein [Chitinophagaceae bacterium]